MMTTDLLWRALGEPWKPHNYQKKAVKFLLEHACAALFLDPGLGKTSIVLAAIKILKERKLLDKVLLVAPLRVCHLVWPKELQKWVDFHGLTMQVVHGPNKDVMLRKKADIYVVNPEGLDWLLASEKTRTPKGKVSVNVNRRRFKAFGFDTLVIDELSKFKRTSTGRFKALKQVINTFQRRWGLTGSPAANGLMDLFGQCYILDEGRTLGPFITKYRAKYFTNVDNGYVWALKEGGEDEIYKRLSPLALRMAAEDYLELPKLIENNIVVDLPDDVRVFYDELFDELIAEIDTKIVVAANAPVKSLKCRQIASGGVYYDDRVEAAGFKLPRKNREWLNLHHAKTDALVDLIEELQGSPILVAYEFEHDMDRIREKLGKDVPYIGGGVSTKRSKELESLWNAGKLPWLFGHPQSMAHGLNFQEAGHHVAWYTLTWDFELYDQFIRRVLRQGNKADRVFCHHLMARDTVDFAVRASLRSKNKGQQALFTALKELAKVRRKKVAQS